jgi:hypothetical protein
MLIWRIPYYSQQDFKKGLTPYSRVGKLRGFPTQYDSFRIARKPGSIRPLSSFGGRSVKSLKHHMALGRRPD